MEVSYYIFGVSLVCTNDCLITAHLAIAVLLGLIFGVFWLSVWWFYGIPAVSTVLVTLTLGYLTASVIYFAGTGMKQHCYSHAAIHTDILHSDYR